MGTLNDCYCSTSATGVSNGRIIRVTVGTIDHGSSANTRYEDHTAVVGELVTGADNALTIQYGWVNAPNGYAEDQVPIWTDHVSGPAFPLVPGSTVTPWEVMA